mmetsp:Transcript_4894/g.14594  ORF Transcript_4894/g.14594 Transcript_4894/m.14594 type:complete len:201 (+) Transcript_4894:2001-2603(+)
MNSSCSWTSAPEEISATSAFASFPKSTGSTTTRPDSSSVRSPWRSSTSMPTALSTETSNQRTSCSMRPVTSNSSTLASARRSAPPVKSKPCSWTPGPRPSTSSPCLPVGPSPLCRPRPSNSSDPSPETGGAWESLPLNSSLATSPGETSAPGMTMPYVLRFARASQTCLKDYSPGRPRASSVDFLKWKCPGGSGSSPHSR